ncbi:hypothetical protein LDVICp002 [lymphocystis disease virus-China]|uniref:Caspase recruitment domain-containing protein n=2 Tax=Lymphocystis disease virus 2 TaxID=159183 RepID=A0A6F8WZU4_9VIRU|nr:hypothetical protein LDVICp002 [lymphocystis disease virus-China]AAU10851.1 hypothetical protein [lymphocystis disease virus-China]BCB67412.1 caspase recruitment domain-containing protein [Lymphocystis disease virus 2]
MTTDVDILFKNRVIFINNLSLDTVDGLLDRLLHACVLTQSELEYCTELTTKSDKIRFLVDSCCKKGNVASNIFLYGLYELDNNVFSMISFKNTCSTKQIF